MENASANYFSIDENGEDATTLVHLPEVSEYMPPWQLTAVS